MPSYSAVLVIDLLAAGTLAARTRSGRLRFLKALIAIVAAPTVLVHGFLRET